MSAYTKPPVVAGVDGTDQGLQAVRFAVAEAQRAGCGVRLVHVMPETAATAPIVPLSGFESFDKMAEQVMQQAEDTVRAAAGDGIPLERVVRPGTRVHILLEASEDARMVVLGHRDRPLRERVFTASTSTGMASRAHCPVVCIPPNWPEADQHGRIVVGIKDPDNAAELLSLAFAAASGRRAGLRVLHAWRLQRPYDPLIARGPEVEAWTSAATDKLSAAIAGLASAFPDVEAQVDVRHEDPAAALLAATEDADLLLLARRVHVPRVFSLGSTARALIREAHCPVEITPLHPARRGASSADAALTSGGS